MRTPVRLAAALLALSVPAAQAVANEVMIESVEIAHEKIVLKPRAQGIFIPILLSK